MNTNFQTHIFDNGLKIIYQKSYSILPITSIQVFCDVGSAHEPENMRGFAHFIEHMCFTPFLI
jgi:predicted Zn-dependent peptidase